MKNENNSKLFKRKKNRLRINRMCLIMKIIIDSRMREVEKEYLSRFGELVEIVPQDSVYEEISGHPDIFFTKLKLV